MTSPVRFVFGALLALCAPAALAAVASYLPLSLAPEVERQIDRALVTAGEPALARPITVTRLTGVMPAVCEADTALCAELQTFLERYSARDGVALTSVEIAATSGVDRPLPNSWGLESGSPWRASFVAFLQLHERVAVSVGATAYDGEVVPVGTMLSAGFDWAQLDVGWKPRSWSPMREGSLLIGPQAPTMPSATLSNPRPLTRWNLRYEAFLARMSTSDRIAFNGGFTSGHPELIGLHASIEPVPGWALGFNRLLQFGGGARGGQSVSDILRAFFDPGRFDNTGSTLSSDQQAGNQLASFTSSFTVPGPKPLSVYFEYAGEDTSRASPLPGNSALSAGIHLPRVSEHFDFTYEFTEWQNAWYVNGVYGDGLTHRGRVVGHWFGEQRLPGDGVGGQAHVLRVGWQPAAGQLLEARYRTLANESYGAVTYRRAHELNLRWSQAWGTQLVVGAEIYAGRDVFGDDYGRLAAFVRFLDGEKQPLTFAASGGPGGGASAAARGDVEWFVDAGVNANKVRIDITPTQRRTTSVDASPHLGFGVRRAVTARSDVGARLELDDIDGHLLAAVRAVDYRLRLGEHLALTGFLGAARYDLATPAYGLYAGFGGQWRDVRPGWDVGVDVRAAIKVARDRLLPGEVADPRPDAFYDVYATTLYLTRRF